MFDWGNISKANFDDERRKKLGLKTGKQLFAEAHDRLQKAKDKQAWRNQVEPLLKAELIQHMVNRKPISVISPIQNPTEGIPGQEEDEDNFYNVQKSSSVGSFVELMETIPAGSELIFKSWDKTLGQWIFKSNTGKEYAIYDKPKVMFKQQAIENPGFFGLLYQTNIKNVIDNQGD